MSISCEIDKETMNDKETAAYNQKKTAGSVATYNEERRLGEFNTRTAYLKQGKAASKLLDNFEWTGTRTDTTRTNRIVKGQKR